MKLTSEQITQFQVSGYVYLGEILNAKELKVAREAYHRVFDSKPSSYRDIGLEDSETGQQKAVLQQVLNIEVNEDEAVSVHVPAGHAMMHHCLTVHGTRANLSDWPRRAIAITYMPADALQRGKPMTENPLLRGSEAVYGS